MHMEVTPSRRTYNTDRAAPRDRNCKIADELDCCTKGYDFSIQS